LQNKIAFLRIVFSFRGSQGEEFPLNTLENNNLGEIMFRSYAYEKLSI